MYWMADYLVNISANKKKDKFHKKKWHNFESTNDNENIDILFVSCSSLIKKI